MNLSRCEILVLLAALLLTSTSCMNQNPPPAAPRSRSPELVETTSAVPGERVFGNVDQYRSIDSFSFSTDMRYLVATGDSGDLQLLEVGSGTRAYALEGHNDLTYVVAFAPESSVFAVCGSEASGDDGGRHCDFALNRRFTTQTASMSRSRRMGSPSR
jgi:WD40 repeat protein